MIDTHSHLYVEEFSEDIDAVLERARSAGVSKVFLPNINKDSLVPMLDLCAAHRGFLYPMIGLHPTDVASDYTEVLDYMEAQLQENHPFVAVGEVGLDFYWDKTFSREQQDAFVRQIEWAVMYELPLMVHVREAHKELLHIMDSFLHESLTGVFHCFSGTMEEARQLLAYEGFMLGINGVATFKKSGLPNVLQQIPLERIVLETDSPYLAPVPYRGKRNESAYLALVASKLAELYQIPVETVAARTTKNASDLFKRAN
ncbi:MAG: TatD family hydrolase [Paraprevotella sp.]|nr:TatD family hydrolase [Paraprevotella sp.]